MNKVMVAGKGINFYKVFLKIIIYIYFIPFSNWAVSSQDVKQRRMSFGPARPGPIYSIQFARFRNG